MIQAILILFSVGVVSVCIFAFEPVTALPFGIDPYISDFAGTILWLSDRNPIFYEFWKVFIIALGFVTTLFVLEWSIKLWRMIRG